MSGRKRDKRGKGRREERMESEWERKRIRDRKEVVQEGMREGKE